MTLALVRCTEIECSLSRTAPSCPRCRSTELHKWGRYQRIGGCGATQRYRCKECGKTFNEFTGTPLAHLKYQDKWADIGWCLLEGLSVRRSAEELQVHPSTAFRWRHRFLSPVRDRWLPQSPGTPEHFLGHGWRLQAWAAPLRKVGARYYHNYLAWFSLLDKVRSLEPDEALRRILARVHADFSVAQQLLDTVPTVQPWRVTVRPLGVQRARRPARWRWLHSAPAFRPGSQRGVPLWRWDDWRLLEA
jgi:transposase-like protein